MIILPQFMNETTLRIEIDNKKQLCSKKEKQREKRRRRRRSNNDCDRFLFGQKRNVFRVYKGTPT